MFKKLVGVGNSMAVTIDRPIRDLLRIDKDTLLRLTLGEGRLIIEPVRERPAATGSARAAGRPRAATGALPYFVHLPTMLSAVDPSERMLEIRRRAKALFFTLYDTYDLNSERLKRFHHTQVHPLRYLTWLDLEALQTDDPHEIAAMRRNERCFLELRNGRTIEEAMEAALCEEPLDMEPSVAHEIERRVEPIETS